MVLFFVGNIKGLCSDKCLKMLLLCVVFFGSTAPAYAYIGPGLATGTIGAVLGVLGGLLLAIFTVIYYPIKRFVRKLKNKKNNSDNDNSDNL